MRLGVLDTPGCLQATTLIIFWQVQHDFRCKRLNLHRLTRMPEETIPRRTPQRREGSGCLRESLPMVTVRCSRYGHAAGPARRAVGVRRNPCRPTSSACGASAFFAARRASWLHPVQLVRALSAARIHASTAQLSDRHTALAERLLPMFCPWCPCPCAHAAHDTPSPTVAIPRDWTPSGSAVLPRPVFRLPEPGKRRPSARQRKWAARQPSHESTLRRPPPRRAGYRLVEEPGSSELTVDPRACGVCSTGPEPRTRAVILQDNCVGGNNPSEGRRASWSATGHPNGCRPRVRRRSRIFRSGRSR